MQKNKVRELTKTREAAQPEHGQDQATDPVQEGHSCFPLCGQPGPGLCLWCVEAAVMAVTAALRKHFPLCCFSASLSQGLRSEQVQPVGQAPIHVCCQGSWVRESLAFSSVCHGRPVLPPAETLKGR